MRKKTSSKRDEYIKLKELSQSTSTDVIGYEAGGSINNLPVNTPEFKNWLELHRERNPFIGKHVTAAPEYNVEQMDLGTSSDEDNKANEELLQKINDNVIAFNIDEEEVGVAPKVDEGKDKMFIDMLLVENAAKRLVNKSTEEIQEHAVSMMRSYHNDPNYNTGLDLGAVVEQSKVLAIANKTNDKKYLRNY